MQQYDHDTQKEKTVRVLVDHREREPRVTGALRDLGADVLVGRHTDFIRNAIRLKQAS